MGGFDRSKLRATAVGTLQQQEEDHATKRPSSGNQDRTIISIDAGDNKVRVFPFHPEGGGESYVEAKCISFLEIKSQKYGDDKKPIEGEFELRRKPIFNSKVHGGLAKDLVEEYMRIAKDVAIPNLVGDDKARFKKVWGMLTGKVGVKPSDSWAMYATKLDKKTNEWGPVGILEVKKSVKDGLLAKAVELSSDTATPDPYSDPDTGLVITITKTGKDLDTRYAVSVESTPVRNGNKLTQEYIGLALTDEQLEQWSKLKPLYQLFVNSYKRSDFEKQIEGLQNFDEWMTEQGQPIQVFQHEEFLDVLNELDTLIPETAEAEEEEQEEETPAAEVEKPKPTVVKKASTTVTKPAATKPAVTTPAPTKAAEKVIETSAPKTDVQNRTTLESIRAKYGKKP